MEKYAIIREYTCECGCRMRVADNSFTPEYLEKSATLLTLPGHMHTFKEVRDVDGETEGRSFRIDRSDTAGSV
jgi:hypothetical protein